MKKIKVIFGADHAGFAVKEKLKEFLKKKGVIVKDVSQNKINGDDYPLHAFVVAEHVAKSRDAKGILVCNTGTGMVIAANKVKGIRAAEAYDLYSAKMSRLDNDANVLGLRSNGISFDKLKRIVEVWLKTPFSGKARHMRRIQKIVAFERK